MSSCGSGFAFAKRPREPADRQGAAIPMPTAVDAIERENDWLRKELANARRDSMLQREEIVALTELVE